jgi:hypothetical protein
MLISSSSRMDASIHDKLDLLHSMDAISRIALYFSFIHTSDLRDALRTFRTLQRAL